MFSYLKGILTKKASDYVVVECGGVGFKIYTSITSISDPDCVVDSEVLFHTHMYIKEGIMDLYGFSTYEELELFELLISVNGVGAKGATALLSSANPAKLSLSIATGDVNVVKKAPGIGPKTAQRIILELKDKIKCDNFENNENDFFSEVVPLSSGDRDEASNALIALGYSAMEAKKAVASVNNAVTGVEEIIKQALKSLM